MEGGVEEGRMRMVVVERQANHQITASSRPMRVKLIKNQTTKRKEGAEEGIGEMSCMLVSMKQKRIWLANRQGLVMWCGLDGGWKEPFEMRVAQVAEGVGEGHKDVVGVLIEVGETVWSFGEDRCMMIWK